MGAMAAKVREYAVPKLHAPNPLFVWHVPVALRKEQQIIEMKGKLDGLCALATAQDL
jgi:hypothetical protein